MTRSSVLVIAAGQQLLSEQVQGEISTSGLSWVVLAAPRGGGACSVGRGWNRGDAHAQGLLLALCSCAQVALVWVRRSGLSWAGDSVPGGHTLPC